MIVVDEFAAMPCRTAEDCPRGAYTCVPTGDGEGFCEVIYPLRPSDGGTGSDGGGVGVDAGPTPYYCTDIAPIMERTCVANCHGPDTSGSGQTTFRLDYYEMDGGLPGCKAKAARIKYRMSDKKEMPPPGAPMPTDEERAIVSRWVNAGAPLCDGGNGG